MKDKLIIFKKKMELINKNRLFEELYCIILMIITIICWKFDSLLGMILLLIIGSVSLFIFNDFKYIIPCVLDFLCVINTGFSVSKVPISIVVCGILFVVILFLFVIKKGFKFSKIKYGKGLFFLSISCILPLIWNHLFPQGQEALYLLSFTYLLYFIVFIISSSSLDSSALNMFIISIGYFALILAFECILKVIYAHSLHPEISIFSLWYYLGFILCNEAGIMMCFCLPFIFLSLIRSKSYFKIVVNYIKIMIIAIGMVLTCSRATLLFGTIELIMLYIVTIIFNKKKIFNIVLLISLMCVSLIIINVSYGINKLIDDIKNVLFFNDFDDTGRFDLWKKAIEIWKKDFVSMTFGSGYVCDFIERKYWVFEGYEVVETAFTVFHSTFFECLVCFGNLGVAFLIWHFIEKYKQLSKLNNDFFICMLIGYIIVDIYGLIDNTYGMIYYMLPLVFTMSMFNNIDKKYVSEYIY